MDITPQFPNDKNGDVFRQMIRDGDDLSFARTIDFCHIFSDRKQALAFVEEIDDCELEVCISYYMQRHMWQVIVKRYMIPTYQDVTSFELSMAAKAELHGGQADGWGCMVIEKKNQK
jgi:hypothetical protein